MRGGPFRGTAAVAILLLCAASPILAGDEVRDFFNVIAPDAADPSVYRHADGRYYATMTTGGNVTLWRSETLSGLGGGERKVIWTAPATGPTSRDVWAPELLHARGKWCVYFAADDGDNANHRMYVLENGEADPFEGQFAEKGRVFDPANDRWAIDGAVLDLDEKLYLVWSGLDGGKVKAQALYIAPMSDPSTISGPRVEISRPTLDWETRGAPPAINEGPQFLVRGRMVYLIYSASGSWTDHYCLGMLTANRGDDLLSPKSWKKHRHPVFQSKNGVFGPGHCAFTTSPDGKEHWLLYHAARYRGAGWNREVRAQPFAWDESGLPRFGVPVPPDTPIPLPGGEPSQVRFEAEAMALGRDAKVVPDRRASGGSKVVFDGKAGAYGALGVTVKQGGPYNVSVRFRNSAILKPPAARSLTVNDERALKVRYAPTGPDDWSCAVIRLDLKPGANRLRFGEGGETVEIDCLSVFPTHRKVGASR